MDNRLFAEGTFTGNALLKSRALYILLLLALFILAIWQISEITETKSLSSAKRSAILRADLYANSLRNTLEKYRHLPYMLSRDTRIVSLLRDDIPSSRVSPHLEDFARESGALIFVLDKGGTTVASSNWRSEKSLLGHNFSFRPYFIDAKAGTPGGYYSVGLRTGQPGFFLSYPVRHMGEFLGAIVVKVYLEAMQEAWKNSGEAVIVSDMYGVIFLTSNSRWKYSSLRSLSDKTIQRLRAVQYLNHPLTALKVSRKSLKGHNIVEFDRSFFLEQPLQLPEYGWRLHYLTNLENVRADVKLAVSLSAIFGFLIFITLLYLRERRQKLIAKQEANKAAAVHEINERLLQEIAEHKQTENNLRQTQKELIQAGKLAALGRMSAAIAHELNQPVTAIRTFVASCKLLIERNQIENVAENLNFINRLTERMAKITGQLKTFARKSKGREEVIDTVHITKRVIDLLQPQIVKSQVTLNTYFPPLHCATVAGDSLQVEQVLSNLMHNALDAMHESPIKELSLSVKMQENSFVTITLADSGPGIQEEALDNLFDPFFTTKDIGEGLGLGLSISYGIIKDMGGTIRAENISGSGARFIVKLPLAAKDTTDHE